MTAWERLARDLLLLAAAATVCGVIWKLLYELDPTLIVSTTNGLQTLFPVIAAAIVAMVALLLGSVFLIAQHVAALFGQRGVTVLLLESRVRFMLALALLIAVGALVIAGQVPINDTTKPPELVTAAAGMLAIASSAFLLASTLALGVLMSRYTSSQQFMKHLVETARKEPEEAVKTLGHALRLAARHGHGRGMQTALEGLKTIGANCEKQAAGAIVCGGEEALRNGALWRDLDRFVETLECLAKSKTAAKEPFVDGLAELLAFGRQLPPESPLRTGWLPRCAESLTRLGAGGGALANRAMAGWALATVSVADASWKANADCRTVGHAVPTEECVKEVAKAAAWISSSNSDDAVGKATALLEDVA